MELQTGESNLQTQNKHTIKQQNKITKEDAEIIMNLDKVKRDLDLAQKSFDIAVDEALVDSFAYEIMSLNKRYEYFIKLCKEKGLIAQGFN